MAGQATRSDLATRIRLFASSYAPLFALLALRFENSWLRIVFGAAAALFLCDTVRIAVVVPKRVGASPYRIATVADEGGQVAGYLATYLLPFLVAPFPSATDLVAYALFLVVAGVVSVRSNLTHVNPTLYLLGFRLISLTTSEGFTGFAAVRSQLEAGDILHANHLGSHLLVEVKRDQG